MLLLWRPNPCFLYWPSEAPAWRSLEWACKVSRDVNPSNTSGLLAQQQVTTPLCDYEKPSMLSALFSINSRPSRKKEKKNPTVARSVHTVYWTISHTLGGKQKIHCMRNIQRGNKKTKHLQAKVNGPNVKINLIQSCMWIKLLRAKGAWSIAVHLDVTQPTTTHSE